MVRTRFRTQNPTGGRRCTTPEEEIERKREAYNKARDDLKEAVLANKKPRTAKDDLAYVGQGALRVGSEIINRGARVGDAFERDLRRNSLQGQIDQAIINAMFEKNKASAKSATKTKRRSRPVIVEFNGKQIIVDQSQVHPTSTRRRRN